MVQHTTHELSASPWRLLQLHSGRNCPIRLHSTTWTFGSAAKLTKRAWRTTYWRRWTIMSSHLGNAPLLKLSDMAYVYSYYLMFYRGFTLEHPSSAEAHLTTQTCLIHPGDLCRLGTSELVTRILMWRTLPHGCTSLCPSLTLVSVDNFTCMLWIREDHPLFIQEQYPDTKLLFTFYSFTQCILSRFVIPLLDVTQKSMGSPFESASSRGFDVD